MLISDLRKPMSRLLILMIFVSWLVLLTGSSSAFFVSTEDVLSGPNGSRLASQIPVLRPIKVIIDQLPADKGLIPVEIEQVQISSSAPDQVESLSYLVRNNTHKGMTAFAVARTIKYDQDGAESEATAIETVECALHPDFNETSTVKSLAPGANEPLELPGAVSFGESAVIKEVRLQIDYVQFDDGSVFGSGSDGERQVTLAREGAVRYKTWLKERYIHSGKSLATVLALLQNDDVPEELDLKDLGKILGAKNYRLLLLKIFQTDDPAKVEKYLNR